MSKQRRLIYQLNQARHQMMRSLDEGCKNALGISAVQLSALMVLREQQPCRMQALAKALMLDKSAVTGLAKRMQAAELIARKPCPQDSRASLLSMTEKGETLLQAGIGLLIDVNQIMDEGFSEAELDTVSRYLQHLTRLFSKET